MKKVLIILLRQNDKKLTEILDHCKLSGLDPVVFVPTYSFFPETFVDKVKILRPMDILSAEQIDDVLNLSFSWQRDLFKLALTPNFTVSHLKIPSLKTPKIWAWAHLLIPHIFLQFRFCLAVDKALGTLAPDFIQILDNHSALPWKRLLVESIHKSKFPYIATLKIDGADVSADESQSEQQTVRRSVHSQLVKRVGHSLWRRARAQLFHYFYRQPIRKVLKPTIILAVQMLLKTPAKRFVQRFKHLANINLITTTSNIKKLSEDSTYTLSQQLEHIPNKQNILFLLLPHQAPWYFNFAKGHWSICDEYSEGVLEELIAKCDPSKHVIHVMHMTGQVTFDKDRLPYSVRHPQLVREYTTKIFNGARRPSLWFFAFRIWQQMRLLYRNRRLHLAYNYSGVKLNPLGLLPLFTLFSQVEVNFLNHRWMWHSVMKTLRPSIVVSGRMEAWPHIIEVAREFGAKVVGIRLGIAEEMIPGFLKLDGSNYSEAHNCDLTVLWGEEQKKYLMETIPELKSEVEALGRPRLDTFINNKMYIDRSEVRNTLGLSQQDRVILFGATITTRYGQWNNDQTGAAFLGPKSYQECIDGLDSLCDEMPNLKILLKPWAGDDVGLISKCIGATRNSTRFLLSTNRDSSLHNIQYLKAVDLVVSNVSCLFAESVCMDLPVVNLAFPEIEYLYGPRRIELYNLISSSAKNVKDMQVTIRRFLSDPDAAKSQVEQAQRNIHRIFGKQDGRIASRIATRALAFIDASPDIERPRLTSRGGYTPGPLL